MRVTLGPPSPGSTLQASWEILHHLSGSVDCDWLEGILVLLLFSQAPSLSVCLYSLQAFSWNWLTDWLSDWRDQCSRTMFTRDQPRSHMTPAYIPLCLGVASQRCSGLQPKKPECDRNNCMRMKDILSQSHVSDPLTCRHGTLWTHKYHISTWSMNAHARASIYARKAQQWLPMLSILAFTIYILFLQSLLCYKKNFVYQQIWY